MEVQKKREKVVDWTLKRREGTRKSKRSEKREELDLEGRNSTCEVQKSASELALLF